MMAASSSNENSTLNYPLALLAETCKKISTTPGTSGESTSINKVVKAKKSPVKIAPAPKYVTITTVKPQVTALPQKFVVQVVGKNQPDIIKNASRQIFTVPLLSPLKTETQSQQSTLQTAFTAPKIFGVNTATTCNGVVVVPQGRLLQPQNGSLNENNFLSTNIATGHKLNSNVTLSSSVSQPKSLQEGVLYTAGPSSAATGKQLTQISALKNIPQATPINMKIPDILESSPKAQELDKLIYINRAPQQNQQTTNETNSTNSGDQNAQKNTTIQITLPPNASFSSLQNILQLAANAAKKYQVNEPRSNVVTSVTPQIYDNDVMMADNDETLKQIVRNETGNKKRSQCNCPNCLAKDTGRFYTGFSSSRGEKHMHVCSYLNCRKEFRKTSHLKSHMRTHTGERPYSCQVPQCGRKFTRSDELLRHLRTHTGIKKFQCIYCEKKFTRSDHLKKHSKTHFKNISSKKLKE